MNISEKLLTCPAVPGDNKKMTEIIRGELERGDVEYRNDALGNSFFTRKFGDGKKLMLCTGLDFPGLAATYAEKSRIYVGKLGEISAARLAYSRIVFGEISGILVPPADYTSKTAAEDCYVETYDDDAENKIVLGEKGYPELGTVAVRLESGFVSGYGVPMKARVSFLVRQCKERLFSAGGEKLLKKAGFGTVTAAFLGQSSVRARGAAVAADGVLPDEIILIADLDLGDDKNGFGRDTDFAVKVADKRFVCDEELTAAVCGHFDENGIKYKKYVGDSEETALSALSRCSSSPRCCEISIPVFNAEAVSERFFAD